MVEYKNFSNISPPQNLENPENFSLSQPIFPGEPSKVDIASIVIGNISIPSELLSKYWHLLSEITILGNLSEVDIYRFCRMYIDWECDFLMEIPNRLQNEKLIVTGVTSSGEVVEETYGLNELLNRLRLVFELQLRRSKEGFTLTKLTELKQVIKEELSERKRWKLWPFS